jgi:hypothetical protein
MLIVLGFTLASLWSVEYLSPARRVHVKLAQGALSVRLFRADDFAVSSPGFALAGFSAHRVVLVPRLALRDRLWIAPLAPPGTLPQPGAVVTPLSYQIPCSTLILPLLPLAALAALVGGGWLLVRRSRRRAGHCRVCGYDRRGLRGPCPECADDGATWALRLARRLSGSRAAPGSPYPLPCASCTSQPA